MLQIDEKANRALATLAASGLCGLLLGCTGVSMAKRFSATMMLVLQNTNKVLLILGATILFHDTFNAISATGCAISLLGSFGYAWIDQTEKTEATQPQNNHLSKILSDPSRK